MSLPDALQAGLAGALPAGYGDELAYCKFCGTRSYAAFERS